MSEKPDKTSNIPTELASAPSTPLAPLPANPETAQAVKEFLRQRSTDAAVPSSPDAEEPIQEAKIDVPPNGDFDQTPPEEAIISNALADDTKIKITPIEKEIFLKAVLNDEPVRLQVSLYNGSLVFDMRSRSTFEQRRVFDILELDREEGVIPKDNVSVMITRTHYYLAALMIERVNGKMFSDLTLAPSMDRDALKNDASVLRKRVFERLEGMAGVRWNSFLSALRIFETKCAMLNTEAANEDFWKPPGSV